jgi:hypothetical protein
LLTIAMYWIGVSYALGIVLAADQLRRPLSLWETAGVSRRFWVSLSLAMAFHGLGEYALVAYVAGVVPRLQPAGQRGPWRALREASAAFMRRWRGAVPAIAQRERRSAAADLAYVAALLVLVSSIIHSAQIAPHFEQYWLYGAFFAVAAIWQAIWAARIYGDPLNRRVLLTGIAGNAALIVVWAISRTAGVPIGPQGWHPEAVSPVDVLSKLDELGAVVLIALVLARLREKRPRAISPLHLRLAAMLAGPLFLYSVLAAAGGHHH